MKRLISGQSGLTPFHPEVLDFTAALASTLRRTVDRQAFPALAALAFWVRPTAITQLQSQWARLNNDEQWVRQPRGVAFHIPPTNVDTLFVYSWILSALVGNANVIRISPNSDVVGSPLLDAIQQCLADHQLVDSTTAIVSYAHDESVTREFSGGDVRVIWGGDDTVLAIRQIALRPGAAELTFPDRFSLCALDAPTVFGLGDSDLDALAVRFFNDAYWFDQLGCASPRLVVWRGEVEVVARAASRFWDALQRVVVARSITAPVGVALAKITHASATCAGVEGSSIRWNSNELVVADMGPLDSIRRDGPGGGLFYSARVESLHEIAVHTARRDQTLTAFGFSADELAAFARGLNANGIDRIVPVGDALHFDRYWDGQDLLERFSRGIRVLT